MNTGLFCLLQRERGRALFVHGERRGEERGRGEVDVIFLLLWHYIGRSTIENPSLETLVLGDGTHHLADTKVAEHLLGAAEDGVELLGSLLHLNELAHAGLGDATATEDLDGVVGDLARETSAHHLEEGDLAGKVLGLLLVLRV
jgi:hypothetical protein